MKEILKKSIIAVCVIAIAITLLPLEIMAKSAWTEEEEVYMEDVLDYQLTSLEWDQKLKKYVIEGYFCNLSEEYDLFDFSNMEVVIADIDGLEMFTIKVNEKVQKAMLLPPGGTWTYNMTVKELKYDADQYNQSGWIQSMVFGECSYAECEGVGCPVCGKTKEDSSDTQWGAYNGAATGNNAAKEKNDSTNQYKCSWCNGTGICKECGGTGKNNASSMVLKSMGCTLCDKTGKCAKCGGDGWASY